MQKIFIEKPYQFVKPVMANWIPWLMNNRLIHRPLLWFTESIVSVESHGVGLLKSSVDAGHAVMMIGNHPRVSDPVAIYDLIRQANTPMFAMASWHLFNKNWFNSAVLRLYGGYSVNREGLDRQSINFSVTAMQENIRPVLMFPEGATSRTNESLMPFLDGPTFVARTAARRRHKRGLKTVIHPIVVKYTFVGDFEFEFDRIMVQAEDLLGIDAPEKTDPATRVKNALNQLVAKREFEFDVDTDQTLVPAERRLQIADSILKTAEIRAFGKQSNASMTNRIRDIRSTVFPELMANDQLTADERQQRWRDLERTYVAWQMASYPRGYLDENPSKDRILEIAAKILEDLTDTPRLCGKQKVTIEVCEAIEVPPAKHQGPTLDPLVKQVRRVLESKLNGLNDGGDS